ncbi:septum formation protein Maf [Halomonas sp. S2151]|uniref:Maf family protein n=1 Tax=Halomonas sp. S2151 TaxID=579478 RepID=UPI0005F9FBF8|nr:nucleoside triphosphate pyrophosphatase [Halomonas sp. S2151]KJZ12931.1 septum formation protein Maf [Halomonas sp. S2151]
MSEPLDADVNSPVLRLASASPRRRELLASIGVAVEIAPVDIDETPHPGEAARDYVARLARAKAKAVAGAGAGAEAETEAWRETGLDLPVLGSDTSVVRDGEILGKPVDAEDAFVMLRSLSGRWHQVMTSVAVSGPAGVLEATVVSDVLMRELQDDEIRAYWRTGEPADKAGGYAIQGLASIFVERVEGSYSAVVGLPLYETASLLRRQRVPVWNGALL